MAGNAERNVSAVKDLLSKAVKAIDGLDDLVKNSTTSQTTSLPMTPRQVTFKSELEQLFPNVYGPKKRATSAPASSISSRSKKRNVSCKKKEKTVTRKFVCLAERDQLEIPSAQEKRDLFVWGLGEKKIALALNGTYSDLHDVLLNEFQKLSSAGGFELMFAEQGKRELHMIPSGPSGMTVDYISQFIGQGRIYVRPIQCNLDQTEMKVCTEQPFMEEMCNSCLEFVPMDQLRKHAKNCPKNAKKCNICLEQISTDGVSPNCCKDVFHSECLEEWHKMSQDGSGSQCPVCKKVFFSIGTKGNNDYNNLTLEKKPVLILDDVPCTSTDWKTTNITQQRDKDTTSASMHNSSTNLLPSYGTTSSDSFYSSLLFDDEVIIDDDSDFELEVPNEDQVEVRKFISENSLEDILSGLAKAIDDNKISKFNVCRSDIWGGAKRGLTRKSFSPSNKISVKFSDDYGSSEGAVDRGGPTREFFTLVLGWMVDSQIFCGQKESKFLSCNAKYLENCEYFYAGQIVALSLVHGGPGIRCLSTALYDALVKGPNKSVVAAENVYDPGLKSSLQQLSEVTSVKEAYETISNHHLDTILELGGTLQCIHSMEDVQTVIQQTAHWYTIGRAWPAIEQFKQGLSVLGIMQAVALSPDVFVKVFCHSPETLTADIFSNLFNITFSEKGSNKRATENVIVSYWNDYLQDVDEGETEVIFGDILFFACGCREVPPLSCSLSLDFLHEPEDNGSQSNFPKANTCGPVLQLPVSHKSYNSFRDAMTFAIANTKGFGYG